MGVFYYIILGIVQGITEFIPVSSSGHLVIAQNVFGIRGPQVSLDVILHLGTLLAVVIYFYNDILNIIRSLFDVKSEGFRMAVFIAAGTVPAAVIGFLFKARLEGMFGSPLVVSFLLVITGIFIFLTRIKEGKRKGAVEIRLPDALIIGVAQAAAICPGISRSGATISAGIFRGINRQLCARYSLLLSVPAVLGALVLEAGDIHMMPQGEMLFAFSGFLSSFIAGYIAIHLVIRSLQKDRFYMFAYYCWIVGGISLLYFVKGG